MPTASNRDPDWVFADEPPVVRPVLDMPYASRQKLLVVDDELAAAERIARQEAAQMAASGESKVDWRTLVATLPLVAVPGFGTGAGVLRLVGAVLVATEAYKRLNALRDQGVDVLTVGRSEALALTFPPGHPRDGIVYVGDPALANRYFSGADFHRRTFEHKFAEAVHVLMALGATTIKVHHEYGWDRRLAADLSGPLGPVIGATGKSKGTQSSQSSLLFEAELDPNEPEVPGALVWYPHEPTWQNVVVGRMQYGMRNFALHVRYTDDFGVDLELAAKVRKAKLGLGGEMIKHTATSWRLEGRFA